MSDTCFKITAFFNSKSISPCKTSNIKGMDKKLSILLDISYICLSKSHSPHLPSLALLVIQACFQLPKL